MAPEDIKQRLLRLDTKNKIRFIVLFGSVAEGRATSISDTDVAVYYDAAPDERFRFRLKACGNLDLHIFQDLSVVVQKEVIRGQVLYYDNFPFLFDTFMAVIRAYDSFEKYYRMYIEQLAEDAGVKV